MVHLALEEEVKVDSTMAWKGYSATRRDSNFVQRSERNKQDHRIGESSGKAVFLSVSVALPGCGSTNDEQVICEQVKPLTTAGGCPLCWSPGTFFT